MAESPYVLLGSKIFQVWGDLDLALGEHPHYSGKAAHTTDNAPVVTDSFGNVIVSENDAVVPIKTNLPMQAGDPVANEDVVTLGFAGGAFGFVKLDGSTPLTADWDIGATFGILADGIRARSGSGVGLFDDNSQPGVFVEDGGQVGIGHTNPDHSLDVNGTFQAAGDCDLDSDVTVGGELNGAPRSFVLSNSTSGSADVSGIYLKSGEILMTATKGLVMRKAGSIIGISIQYDITTSGANIEIQVHKNGASVWGNVIDDSVAADKKDSFTQARDTDTFAAEDILSVIVIAPSGPGPWTVIDDMIVTLDIVYD